MSQPKQFFIKVDGKKVNQHFSDYDECRIFGAWYKMVFHPKEVWLNQEQSSYQVKIA